MTPHLKRKDVGGIAKRGGHGEKGRERKNERETANVGTADQGAMTMTARTTAGDTRAENLPPRAKAEIGVEMFI